MESLFTQATVVIELFGFGYVASSFAVHTHHRWHQSANGKSQRSSTSEMIADQIIPSQRQLTPVEQLRQQCQQAGIKWRDAHGKNRHLKKAEMLAALQQTVRPERQPTPVEQLRQQCQQAGIKWRDAHGKNRHLKKAEMIRALQQLEQAKRGGISPPQPTTHQRVA